MWNPVTNDTLRNTIQSIVTIVVTGVVAMVIIFTVENKIFASDHDKYISNKLFFLDLLAEVWDDRRK